MTVKTTLEQLEEVQNAITAVMSGQEVAVGSKRLRMSDLDALHRREEALLKRYNNENSQGLTVVTGIMKRD